MRLCGVLCLPNVRQELPEFFTRRGTDLRQHAGQVPLWINLVPFAAGDQRPEPGVVVGGCVVAGEEPVLTADGQRAEQSDQQSNTPHEQAAKEARERSLKKKKVEADPCPSLAIAENATFAASAAAVRK